MGTQLIASRHWKASLLKTACVQNHGQGLITLPKFPPEIRIVDGGGDYQNFQNKTTVFGKCSLRFGEGKSERRPRVLYVANFSSSDEPGELVFVTQFGVKP